MTGDKYRRPELGISGYEVTVLMLPQRKTRPSFFSRHVGTQQQNKKRTTSRNTFVRMPKMKNENKKRNKTKRI